MTNAFELTDKEIGNLQHMLQHYRDWQEELYKDYYNPETPETLFTQTQLELFELFKIYSLSHNHSN